MTLVLILLMIGACFVGPTARGRIIRVPGDYPTIQKAVDAANPWDTIYVSAGFYNETVLVYKGVSLIGECKKRTVVGGKYPSFHVNASGVVISNFTILDGIHLGSFEGTLYAWLKNISRCVIANNDLIGKVIGELEGSLIVKLSQIKLNFCSQSIIIGNNITIGDILLQDSPDNLILYNKITNPANAGIGISMYSSWREKGFISDRNVIAYNNITGCGCYGIFICASDGNIIVGNNITNNGWRIGGVGGAGVRIWSLYDVERNFIFYNNFINNWKDHASVMDYRTENAWDDGYPYGGNYYDNYTGIDLFSGPYQNKTGSDGIGDTPYIIPRTLNFGNKTNVDRYPLMNPYRPASMVAIIPLKTVIGEGFAAPINLTMINLGMDLETFNITVEAGRKAIHSQAVTLQGGELTVISFIWNTKGFQKGTYTITAQAAAMSGRRDRFFAHQWVLITIPGDVDGDFDVDIYDVVKICTAYDSRKGERTYITNYDINFDGEIDIFDVVIACANYEQKYP